MSTRFAGCCLTFFSGAYFALGVEILLLCPSFIAWARVFASLAIFGIGIAITTSEK